MKLAEALALRADQKKRLGSLSERMVRYARVQEGDLPAEDPTTLLRQSDLLVVEHEALIVRINRTNLATLLPDGRSLTEAIAHRDALMLRIGTYRKLVAGASTGEIRGMRTEIRFVPMVDVAGLQSALDEMSREHRELDTAIQGVNWTADLLD
jgi:hypothetical protein